MTLADDVRALKASVGSSLESVAAQIDAGASNAAGSNPTTVNCIDGPRPTAPALSGTGPAFTDADGMSEVLVQQDRRMLAMLPGRIPVIGHSQVQAMSVGEISKYCVPFGYAGETSRRLISRVLRPAFVAGLQTAAASVWFSGVCDLSYVPAPYANPNDAADTVTGAIFASRLKPWLTGPTVFVCPVPVDERGHSDMAGYNVAIARMCASLDTIFAGVSNVRLVNVNAQLIDASGNLAPAMHIDDGLHLTGLAYQPIYTAIRGALTSLGIPLG